MIVAVPLPPPVITPVVLPIVAVPDAGEIDQVPVAGVQLTVVVCPTHTESTPVIAPGSGFTVIGDDTSEQPEANV